MKSSSERILTTHGGSLVRPVDLMGIMRVKQCDQPDSEREFATCVRDCVRDVVRKQIETGIDVISDGEYGKPTATGLSWRVAEIGFELIAANWHTLR